MNGIQGIIQNLPSTEEEAIALHVNWFSSFMQTLTVQFSGHASASSAMSNALIGQSDPTTGLATIESAYQIYAVTLAPTFIPGPFVAATPPPVSPSLSVMRNSTPSEDPNIALNQYATILIAWVVTGIAVTPPPASVPTPWSVAAP